MLPFISQLDQDGYFVGVFKADPDQLEPGNWIIPGGAIEELPSEEDIQLYDAGDYLLKFDSDARVFNRIPTIQKEIELIEESLPLNIRKERAIKRLKDECDGIVEAALSEYPESERLTFTIQLQEALNPESGTVFVDMLSQKRGIDTNELRDKIIEKAGQFLKLSAAVAGKRQKLVSMIENSDDAMAIDNLSMFPFTDEDMLFDGVLSPDDVEETVVEDLIDDVIVSPDDVIGSEDEAIIDLEP